MEVVMLLSSLVRCNFQVSRLGRPVASIPDCVLAIILIFQIFLVHTLRISH